MKNFASVGMCVVQLRCDGCKIATILNDFNQSLERKKNFSSRVYGLKKEPSHQEILCLKVMLHGTIRNNDFKRNTALHHCGDIVANGCNFVPTLQLCVALKIVVENRLV